MRTDAPDESLSHGERLRALGEMASGIAHDLNQSLTLITGYSEMAHQELKQRIPDISRVREMVEITARAALEGAEALRGLLSFARTEGLALDTERVNAGDLLHDVARLTAPRWRDASQAEGRPIMLDVTAEPACAVSGSPAALREAITNLIFNAVDALPKGGTIHLVACSGHDQVVVEVSDTGSGIHEEVQSHVFDPFFTTKGSHGSGLGLSQVLAIVKRHGGTIELKSTPGRGTTFRLNFPEADASAPRSEHDSEVLVLATASPGTPSTSLAKHRIRILVVEDEIQLAHMADVVLTQRGHDVVVAATGEEALERLEKQRFDLVISDLGLGPGKNGWDVAKTVRENWAGTRFVLLTGWGAGIDPSDAQMRGVDEVIAKPYRIAALRQVVDRVAVGLGAESH
jgi:CheY-like chemotaxis protein/two-component sensor histidine kinase